ncbi:hypothetical protein Q4610_11055 [Sphingobium sp. HBC34]|uniref:Peptidase S10 n=1 Tax=Sphingobium cyanobacteriorum TaxID=3063954 RepID=A0ABT8ZN00_9SPHN|nr:hypothetical protein [Sphingobium sp. HBC34]MDO7835581.1 hypothetical protein [Sphingobium sp. HBC34]
MALAGTARASDIPVADRPRITDPLDDAARDRFAASLCGEGQRRVYRSVTVRGERIDYELTLGAILLHDAQRQPRARFVYFAYRRRNAGSQPRPVTFAWGGGPSGPATSYHFGCLGPQLQVEGNDMAWRDNPESILDQSDLVFVDPVGTGWSVPAGRYTLGDFYSVAKDAGSVADFILAYLRETGRSTAPIYLTGRSYGTLRLPAVVATLQAKAVKVAGIFPVSAAMDGNAFWEGSGNMAAFYLMLPNYAAIAWHHKRQSQPAATVDAAVAEAAEFALGDYISALMRWPDLPASQRSAVLDRLHDLTGISQDVWARYRLRINGNAFAQEFLKPQGKLLNSGDGRRSRPVRQDAPGVSTLAPPTLSVTDHYARQMFGLTNAPGYRGLAPGVYTDDWKPGPLGWDMTDHRAFHDAGGLLVPCYPNYLDDIAAALSFNPMMRVQQHNGHYDLQCSSFPGMWSLARMNIPAEAAGNVKAYSYASGHGLYDSDATRSAFLENVRTIFAPG